ncbi:T9SS type B sorting domain-containing protein [Flavobacterium sp. FlaQc-28]|uniref:T9SS type B sorting domain-containing protein n=1 Tax=Flavobacterium sp. FlaQc-28 TaxID=3374178 RepID=UPI003758013F
MKKPTNLRLILLALIFLQSCIVISQNLKGFSPRFDRRLKGDMLLIGNNILNRDTDERDPEDAYDRGGYNSDFDMRYIDIDGDPNTFSSSSATLKIPKPACYKIVHAGLYWGAILQRDSRTGIEDVMLKLPKGGYNKIKGEIVYDAAAAPIGSDNNKAYACYADITDLVAGQADAQGEYTVANVLSSQGSNGGTGLSAGWSIFIVYEDPTLPAKFITSFDGFSGIGGKTTLDIPVSGFKTIPTGPVRVKFAFAALEGDQPIDGDYLQINGTTISATNASNNTIRAKDNFFNSSVTYVDPATDKTENFFSRRPDSKNTLGYDAGILNINNPATKEHPGGIVIDNNATSASIRLGSTQDVYFYYFNAFAVDIIEPNIVLTKIVKNSAGANIGGQNVVLGQQLNYEIGFRNTGNDDAKGLTIRDQLPINIIYNHDADLNPLPAGVTVQSYDAATRSIVFKVDDSVVKANTLLEKTISFKVQVVPDCKSLSEACSNSIDNSAYATYRGTLNTDFVISDDPSVNTNTGCLLTPKATNFLIGVDGCKYTESIILCKDDVDLVAANGYTSYTWYSDEARTKQIGTGQILNVKQPGTYYVYNLAAAPCRSIYQAFTVTRFGSNNTNPVIPYAKAPYKGEVLICPNDGKELPNLFLCGANDSRPIKTNISDGSTIVWEKLDLASCAPPSSANCANEGDACNWSKVAEGPDYDAKIAGQYRLTLNYKDGCFNRFYFNVFTNDLNPTEKHKDIICGKPGNITIGDVPAGYVYSIDGINYNTSNSFDVTTAGLYTIYIKQTGVTQNPCIFTVPNIQIRERDFNVKAEVTQPLCYGEKGNIRVAVNDANPQYYYKLSSNGSVLYNVGPIDAAEYEFDKLATNQDYILEILTSDGCTDTKKIHIDQVWNEFKAEVALIEPLTACSDGKVKITPEGGNSPYNYFINSETDFQTENEFVVTKSGLYTIKIVDKNNCTITRTITVPDNPKPTYEIEHTNSNCYDGSSKIEVKLIGTSNGYTMGYSINDGASYQSNPVFSNLQPGVYKVKVKYSMTYPIPVWPNTATKDCFDPSQEITITGPASAISASAGVAALAGCTLPDVDGIKQGGKLRINNVEGGTPDYEYSFDGGANWQTSNEKDVLPGSFILQVKDALGCIFEIPYQIILEPKPDDPTIDVADPVFTCDGKASTTVTVTNPSDTSYTYEYYINGTANTPITNNVFTNVPAGTHTITVKYKVTKVPTYSNLLREDFGRGPDVKIAGIHPNYCWERQDDVIDCNVGNPWGPILLNDGEYVVTQGLLPAHAPDFRWWLPKDNTAVINSTPKITDGRFLAVNVGGVVPPGGVLYKKTINDVIPNQDIEVSLYMVNLLSKTNNLPSPKLTIQLQKNGVPIPGAFKDTPEITRDEQWHNSTDLGNGQVLKLNPGDNTSLDFVILSHSQVIQGNDLAIDDIWVRQIPETCGAEKDYTVIVDSDKAFKVSEPIIDDASCSDKNDGKITITVENFDTVNGFKYSIDGGANWSTGTSSPLIISSLAAGNYKIIVKNDDAGLCSSSFDKTIGAPLALTVVASITVQPTCILGASIFAKAEGGTPNYKYELRKSDGTLVTAFQALDTFTNVPEGDYIVYIQDASDCSSPASDPVSVVLPGKPSASLDPLSDLCYDAVNGSTLIVTATGGKAPYNYSLDGQDSQTENKFTNVGSGTHTIVVTDANGCVADAITGIVIGKELKADAEVTKLLDCTANPDAEITVTAYEGVAPYTYAVSTDGGTTFVPMTGNVHKADKAGSYIFKVTDSNGCSVVTTATTVNAKLTPTATASSEDPSCNNDANGQFTVFAAGGSGAPYTYSFNGSTTFGSDATIKGLDAFTATAQTKDYTYQVKDSKGCLSPVYTITLNNPTKVVASAAFDPNTTCSTTTLVTITGNGGSGLYTYNFDGSINYSTENTLLVTNKKVEQDITYSVKDSKGCIDTKTIKIPAFNPPTALSFSTPDAVTCNITTTSITVTTVNGVAPYTYEITAGPVTGTPNTDGVFTGLLPGNYSFKVTDANGCTAVGSTVIDGAATISVSGSKTDEVCFGDSNGTATFTVAGASSTGNFDYTLTPPSATVTVTGDDVKVTGLTAGKYTLSVKDKTTGCTSNTAEVTIVAATKIVFSVAGSKISCDNKITTLTITGLGGGSPGYSYAYAASPSTGPTTGYGSSLDVDTNALSTKIDVYVKDTKDCFAMETVDILTEDLPEIDPIPAQCYTGTPVVVKITGRFSGTPSFSKDGIFYGPSDTFNLTPGIYKLYVKDGFGCPASIDYIVPEKLTITPTVVPDITCTTDTKISLSSTGGIGTHTYAVSTDGGTTYTTVTSPYTATAAGTYRFRVNDSANPVCYAYTADIPVTLKSTVLTLNTGHTDVKCYNGSTGSILVTPTSGKAPFTYSIKRVGTPATEYTTNNPSGLIEGTYDIVVKDALGCEGTAQEIIIQPTELKADAKIDAFTCNTSNTIEPKDVTITAIGGTLPYSYSFNGGSYSSTGNTLEVSDNGKVQTITYSVKDGNGCEVGGTLTVNPLVSIEIEKVEVTPIYCQPSTSQKSTATITLVNNGVTATLYEIISGQTNTTGAITGIFDGLDSGNYTFRATSANGCYDDFFVNIPPLVSITAVATKLNDVYCLTTPKEKSGNIRYDVGNFVSTYSYSVNGAAPIENQNLSTFTLSNLGAGIYDVEFTDETTKCTVTRSITINEPTDPLDLILDSNVNANCGKATSKVTVHATGGTLDYKYAFKPNNVTPADTDFKTAASADLNPATPDWDVWVKDGNDCTYKIDVPIAVDSAPVVSASVTNQCGVSGNNFKIVASTTGGVAPYTYTINTGVAPSPSDTFTVGAGTYTITVKDANGCPATTVVTVYDALVVDAELTKELTCPASGTTDANIRVTVVTGGKADFSYKVKINGGSYPATGTDFTGTFFDYPVTAAGTYQFEITDKNNCSKETVVVDVKDPELVTASAAVVHPTCNYDKDGSVRLEATAGEGPFTFSFNGNPFGDKFFFGGLAAGPYPYIVRDSKGCEVTGTANVVAPDPIVLYTFAHGITCNSTQPGSMDVKLETTSGGTAPFTFYLYDNTMTVKATHIASTRADALLIHNFPGLDFGDYFVNVVDVNGCKIESAAIRIAPPPYLDFSAQTVGATCDDGISVKLELTGLSGVPNFIYSIYGIGTSSGSIPDREYTFDKLEQNTTYTFMVVDANGCPSYYDYKTPKISDITADVTPKNVTCFNAANGELSFEVKDVGIGTTRLDYEVRDNLTNSPIANPKSGFIDLTTTTAPYTGTITGLEPGNYILYVKEFGGTKCSTTTPFQIKQPASALKATVKNVVPANCNDGAFVTVIAGGGTGPYTYGFYDPAVASAPVSFGDDNVLEIPFTATFWKIVVKDAQGCPFEIGQIIAKDPSPIIALSVANKCVVEDNFQIVVNLTTAGVAPYAIKIDNGLFVDYTGTFPATLSGFHSGSHKITIKDKNDCENEQTINIDTPLKIVPTPTALPDCGVSNGEISFVATGGSGNYGYSISPASPSIIIDAINKTIKGLKEDIPYTLTLSDNTNTGCFTTAEFKLEKGTAVTFDAVVTNALCKGDANGTITVNLLPGNNDPAYTYAISLVSGLPLPVGIVQNDNVFSNLPKENYRITVTSKRLCSLFKDYQVDEPADDLKVGHTVVDFGCTSGNNPYEASVTVQGTGGTTTATSPYQYNFDGGSTYYDVNKVIIPNDGNSHTVDYYVIDANGCKANGTVTVAPFKQLTGIDFSPSDPTCPTELTDVTLTAVGGYAIDKYEIISPISRDNLASPVFTGLAAGTYTFRITDARGCSIERPYKVENLTKINVFKTSSTNVSCNTANGTNNNGTATFTVSDFSTSGNYDIAVASTPLALPFDLPTVANDIITVTGLREGTYTVTVTDKKTNCSKTADVVISMPAPIVFDAAGTKVFCDRSETDITIANVVGGNGNYTYAVVVKNATMPALTAFVGAAVIKVNTALTNLDWDVYVADSKGCFAKKTISITHDAAPILIAPVQQCFVSSFTVDLNIPAISTTYNGVKYFTVNGLPINGSIATFATEGTYKIGLKDDNNCEAFVDYIVEKQLIATADVSKDLYCTGTVDATIDVKISGGKGTYTYQMYFNSAPSGLPQSATGNFTVSVPNFGDYYFVITDSNSPACSVTTNTVKVNDPLTATPSGIEKHIDLKCADDTNGSLTITPSGGLAPYTFVLTGAPGNTTGDISGTYTGLEAGTYSVVVTDKKGCVSASIPVTIIEPVKLWADHALSPNTSCSVETIITVTGHDGTPITPGKYYYNFNGRGYDTTDTFTVYDNNDGLPQTVTYTVKDANDCETAVQSVVVNALNKPNGLTFTPTAITCAPGKDVSDVTVKATNGVGELTFEIIEFNGAAPVPAYLPIKVLDNTVSATFTGLAVGNYKFRVTDSNRCSFEEVMTVHDVTKILAAHTVLTDMSCNTTNDGKVTFEVSNFAGNYTYTITKDGTVIDGPTSTNAATIPLTNLGFGKFEISVVDDITTCPAVHAVTVKQPSIVEVDVTGNINANCGADAKVTVLGKGGSGNYTYSFVPFSPTATPGTFDRSNTAILDPLTPSWYVYAKDDNGCLSLPLKIDITTDPLPAGFTATVTSHCADSNGNYEIVVTEGTGMKPFEYSIGNGFQPGTSFTVKVAKEYNLIVRDKFGCEFEFKAIATILQPLDVSGLVTQVYPSCKEGDGIVSVTTTGGTGTYTYTIDGVAVTAPVTAPMVFDKLSSGPHIIIVNDGNCTDELKFELEKATPITKFDAKTTPVSCDGGSDGTITASLEPISAGINDNPKYMYSIDGGTPQESPYFTGLTAGDYLVKVVSERGCSDEKTVTVGKPDPIIVPALNVTVVPYACLTGNTSNFATITVTGVTGGTGAYTYEFIKDGTQVYKGLRNVYTLTDYLGGAFVINVYDRNGCVGSATGIFNVEPFIRLDEVSVRVDKAITCPDKEDITAIVVTTGGTPGVPVVLNYSIAYSSGAVVLGNPANNSGTFTGLGIGEYIITVVNPSTGCTIQAVHRVYDPNTFEIKATPIVSEVCYGTSDGSVDLTFVDRQLVPSNEAGIFDYVITGPIPSSGTSTDAGPLSISGLKAGQYTVTATLKGKPFCTVETIFSIGQPSAALKVTLRKSEITCAAGNKDGVIYASAEGGWDNNYEYQLLLNGAVLVDYSSQSEFPNLGVGNYTVNVRDGKGCIDTAVEVLKIPDPIVVTAAANASVLSCFGDRSGIITVDLPTGGQGSNYMYTLNMLSVTPVISSGPQRDPIFTGLPAGTYSITVTDGYNCAATSANVVIAEPTEIKPSLVLASSQTCDTQSTLTLSAVGGNPPYTYSADRGFATSTPFTSSVTFSVPVGKYQYYVKDANGCIAAISDEIKIDALEPLTLDLDISNAVIKCMGEATGVIVAEAKGGLGNYVYSLENTAGVEIMPGQPSGRFENLATGVYVVKVVSADCDAVLKTVDIKEPATAIQATFTPTPVSCFGEKNGKIVVTASGGTGTIKYAISPDLNQFDFTNTFEKLAAGKYTVIAQDQNGCYIVEEVEVKQPNPLIAAEVAGSMIPEICAGDKDGEFKIEIKGGTAPYTESLDNEKGIFNLVTGNIKEYIGLTGGKHIVYIKDANGCTALVEINMPLPVTLDPITEVSYHCVNNAQANMVVVKIDDSNDIADVIYALDGGAVQVSNVFTNVSPGTHTITVRHINGCEKQTASFEIVSYEPLALTLAEDKGVWNIIKATATGGGGDYEYSIDGVNFSTKNEFKIYKTGTYTITVRDKNGCTVSQDYYIKYIDVCLDNYFTPNGDGVYDTWGPGCTNIYDKLEFSIFDRYGRIIAKYHYGQKWDGRYNGAELPSGDYWYVLKLNDENDAREFVGHFTLYR